MNQETENRRTPLPGCGCGYENGYGVARSGRCADVTGDVRLIGGEVVRMNGCAGPDRGGRRTRTACSGRGNGRQPEGGTRSRCADTEVPVSTAAVGGLIGGGLLGSIMGRGILGAGRGSSCVDTPCAGVPDEPAANGNRRPSVTDSNGLDCRGRRLEGNGQEPTALSRTEEAAPPTDNAARTAGSGGCGCGGYACGSLIDEIRAVEFALYEVALYLDAYPCDKQALALYHRLLGQRRELVERYEREAGPLTHLGNVSRCRWEWVEKPFPWEADANR